MSSKIMIAIGAVLVIVLVIVGIVLLTGGDDEKSGSASKQQSKDGGSSGDDVPRLRTVSLKRGEGQSAAAAAGGIIEKPKSIWLRVSAAPKQEVIGSWNVSCGNGTTDMDSFTATPPYLLKLRIPRKNAETCVAGASAQLSGKGRLKVAILRER